MSATTVVAHRRAADSPAEIVSCGFFFAPMIPFSDGYRGVLIESATATTAGNGARIVS